MNLLRNPWAVGCLCVVAAVVVGYQFFPHLASSAPTAVPRNEAARSPAPAAPAPAAPVPAQTALVTNAPASASRIDRPYVLAHFAQWLAAPRRDPFLLTPATRPGQALVSPVSKWKLTSIWRQTGSRLAVINRRLYSEGDEIEGYRIVGIESDRVWFQGPTGRESLGFTNAPPSGLKTPVLPGRSQVPSGPSGSYPAAPLQKATSRVIS